jgi:hypothetical protein
VAQSNAIRVDGLDDLVRAFNAADKALTSDLKDALTEAAAPVRRDAQVLTPAAIHNLGARDPWARMRTGVVSRSIVYVAPVERGTKAKANAKLRRGDKYKRRALPPMEQALARNRGRVLTRLDGLLGEVKQVWERYG